MRISECIYVLRCVKIYGMAWCLGVAYGNGESILADAT